jgi:translation initiation factor IF-2
MAKSKNKDRKSEEYRPPVVAMLGHVDHGKTSILDAIRKSSVQSGEVGGITQEISCWTVEAEGKPITFIDTPGHEAFNLMRTYGGEVADIVVLVVAADDSVQPQTKESIEIIKKSETPCIVAINKIDVQGVDIEKVKRELANEGLIVEDMGGDVTAVEMSAETGEGIPELLEIINLFVEVEDISLSKSREGTLGTAFVLESLKDKSKGNVSTVIVTEGEFQRGKSVVYLNDDELVVENLKGLLDERGKGQKVVPQGYSARIIGLSHILELGEIVYCLKEKDDASKEIFEIHKAEVEEKQASIEEPDSDDLLAAVLSQGSDEEEDELEKLKVVLKTESQGSLQAVEKSLEDINQEGLIVEVIKSGVGNIHSNDIEYAKNLGAIVIGFGVEVDRVAKELASTEKILVRTYNLIYDLLDELEDAAIAIQAPEEVEDVVGEAEVRQIFELSDGSRVVGVRVRDGEIKHGLQCKIMRGGDEKGRGKITSMRQEKEKVTATGKGNECGLVIDYKGEIKEDDVLVCYKIVKR